MNVLIVVTHLLGTGHLSRAATLARAFAEAGHKVRVASGGMPVPTIDLTGVELLQLPPIRSDGTDFKRLLDKNGSDVSPDLMTARKEDLASALDDNPDVLITELFPFGRRVLAEEFSTLLETAHALPRPPVILSSIRDILAPPSKPARVTTTEEILARFYDAVLVHSDPEGTPLDASWPVSDRLAERLIYTGYVAPPPAGTHPEGAGTGEILVSAGGGSVGDTLFQTVIGSARLDGGQIWRLLVGGAEAGTRIANLRGLASGAPVIVEHARRDFRQMLGHAACSISMCGYNTALDILQAGTPAVLVPFDEDREVEQTLRARSLTGLPAISVLPMAELTPAILLEKVRAVMNEGPRPASALRFDGAAETVRIAERMRAER